MLHLHRVIPLMLLLLLLISSLAYAEDASVLLEKYDVPVRDSMAEEEKLNILEEEYHVVAQQVNNNTMLSAAYDLLDQYNEAKLASMDLEIYALSDELKSIVKKMDESEEEDVEYIMELDSNYRSVAANLELKRQVRNSWIDQSDGVTELPITINTKKDINRMDALSNRVDEQREKVQEALTYPELGEITSFKSPLAIPVHMTSPFGVRLDPVTREAMTFHKGMDMRASEGTTVLAAFNGYVEEAANNTALGNYVIINHGRGIKTLYGHLSSFQVVKGQEVKQYEAIAKSGNTGSRTTGPHLHFGVFINGKAQDPGVFVPHT